MYFPSEDEGPPFFLSLKLRSSSFLYYNLSSVHNAKNCAFSSLMVQAGNPEIFFYKQSPRAFRAIQMNHALSNFTTQGHNLGRKNHNW